jgi:PLP dependent protein
MVAGYPVNESPIERSAMVAPHDPVTALDTVRAGIELACREAGRAWPSVTLVAVSKTYGPDAVEPVIAAGQRVFGENRVQEARAKWPALRERHHGLELHLIGALQSNKVREAIGLFDAIHCVDRPRLCLALAREIQSRGQAPLLLVQVNTGAEPQKGGVLPEHADAFIAACRTSYDLKISGLMCIPPAEQAPAPHFALTAKIAARNGLQLLSMGMSADFALAIRFGATHVRLGTAIFGARARPPGSQDLAQR